MTVNPFTEVIPNSFLDYWNCARFLTVLSQFFLLTFPINLSYDPGFTQIIQREFQEGNL